MKSFSADVIREAAQRSVQQATHSDCVQWVAFRVEVPWRRVRALCEQPAQERFFWERPSEERTIAAFGVAHAIECEGPDRFLKTSTQARDVFARIHIADAMSSGPEPDATSSGPYPGATAPESAGPLLVGGFGFADTANGDTLWSEFPAARLVLPVFTISRSGDRAWCTAVRAVQPFESQDAVDAICRGLCARMEGALGASDSSLSVPLRADAETADHRIVAEHPHAHYRSRVDSALRDIACGELEKVVVARSVRVHHEQGFNIARITAALRDTYPSCTTFAVSRPGATFLGATPERLVKVEGGRAETAALAGSAPRGRSPEEDERLGRELILSKKEQSEHAVVVRALCDTLAPCCSELEVAEAPRLLRIEGIQHLETPLVGALKGELSAVDLAGRLHPAPSVGGSPRDAALAWLEREEDLDRGWYASPLGWMDASGAGEFCVALRSALMCDREAVLFAGAGIVEGSDPESELLETRLKLRVLLGPLLEI